MVRTPGVTTLRRPWPKWPCMIAVAALVTLAATPAAHAGFSWHHPVVPFLDLGPLEDQIEIVERERELVAIDAWSSSVLIVDLEIGEEVLWSAVRGRVALAITDRRVLAAASNTARWTERRLGLWESSPERVVIGGRVALLATDRRVLAFEGLSGNWSEVGLRPRERVLSAVAGTNVAVAATRERVLGVAAAAGGLFEESLGIREEVDSLRAHGSIATATTRLRLLSFRAPQGSWQSTDLSIR